MPNATWALKWDVVAVEGTELDLRQSSALPVQPHVAFCTLYRVDAARLVTNTTRKVDSSSAWHLPPSDVIQQCA